MNASERPTRRATYQDVMDAPAHRVAEIVDGRLYVSPRPPPLAALAKTCLSAVLGRAFDRGRDGPGGWWIFHEPELHFGEDVVVPDVVGWRRERMAELPTTDYVTLAPDWTCEVLFAETRELDLEAKRPAYAREGVGDPVAVTTGRSYWSAEYLRETRTVYPVYPGWAGVTGHDPVGQLIKRNGTWLPNEHLAAWATDLGVAPADKPGARAAEDWTRQASTKLGARDHRAARSARLLFVAALAAAIGLLCGVLTWVFWKPSSARETS